MLCSRRNDTLYYEHSTRIVTETMLCILTGNTIVCHTRIVAPRRRNCQLKDTAMRFFPLNVASSDNDDDHDDNDDVDNVDDNNLEG